MNGSIESESGHKSSNGNITFNDTIGKKSSQTNNIFNYKYEEKKEMGQSVTGGEDKDFNDLSKYLRDEYNKSSILLKTSFVSHNQLGY